MWNIFSRGFDAAAPPALVLDAPSCLMCVACHPERPALVAAGSFNGEVYVWDTAAAEGGAQDGGGSGAAGGGGGGGGETTLLACTRIDDYFHREPVAQVSWVFDMARQVLTDD